jgi:hypothetical protein
MQSACHQRYEGMIEIRRVDCRPEFDEVYRLRYSIYVDEMGRKQKYANHRNRVIVDPFDNDAARVYGAWDDGELIGTVRSNYLRDTDAGEYRDYYGLVHLNDADVEGASITTRFMIQRRYRLTTLAVRLACKTFQHGLEDGINADFMDCNRHLVNFFMGLGYLVHRNDLIHPEYGAVTVMRLNLNDAVYLETLRSPFAFFLGRQTVSAAAYLQ